MIEVAVDKYLDKKISSVGLWAAMDERLLRGVPAARAATLRQLDELIDKLAKRVHDLVVSTRVANWARVHRMRGAQRLIMLQLVLHSERRGYRKLRAIVELNIEVVAQAGDVKETGGVYVRVNRLTHRMRYVGQTGSFRRRDEEHLREEASALSNANKVTIDKKDKTTTYYQFTAKHGGPGHWIDLPMVVMGTTSKNRDRIRVERKLIPRYGTLNVVYNVWTRPVRKRPRSRPIMRLRGKSEGRTSVVRQSKPTWYKSGID